MAERYVATDDAVRALARWLVGWTWPLDQPAVTALVAGHGWDLVREQPGISSRWDTGLISVRSRASVSVVKGLVADLSVTTADVPDEEPGADRLILDAFADQVAAVSEQVGEPRTRKKGRSPQVEWDLPSGASLAVLGGGGSCAWVLTSPKFVEIERDLARQGR